MKSDERILDAVEDGRDELVGLVTDLIAFDTTARSPGEPARQEADHPPRVCADCMNIAGAFVDRDDGRLEQDDSFAAAKHNGVRRPKVHSELGSR